MEHEGDVTSLKRKSLDLDLKMQEDNEFSAEDSEMETDSERKNQWKQNIILSRNYLRDDSHQQKNI